MRTRVSRRLWLSIAAALVAARGFCAVVASPTVPSVSLGPAVFHPPSFRRAPEARLSELAYAAPRLPISASHTLGPLTASERGMLESRDGRGALRRKSFAVKVGVTRSLPSAVGFEGAPSDLRPGESRLVGGGLLERAADGRLTWTASFFSAGAGALRLHLRDARWPADSRAFVYGSNGEVHGPYAFASGTPPEGFWTNTIFGQELFLEIQFGSAGPAELAKARLAITAIVHLEHPVFAPAAGTAAPAGLQPKSQTCFVDASCVTAAEFPSIGDASRSVGQLNFVDGGTAYVCSGALMNSTAPEPVPYLLTANHCFANQPAATSLEAFWQYKTASCNGPFPNPNLFPRTLGSTLLATGETTDFTLVRLSQDPPDNSVFLGWTTDDVSHAGGTVIHRLSHPDGNPQFYSRHQISATPTPVSCLGVPQGDFIYSKDVRGGTGGGSSGAPAYLGDLRVVGHELGGCGTNIDDDCDVVNNSTVDGAFRVTFPSVQPWLSPGTCTPDPTALCLNGGRFRVTASWATASNGSGAGAAVGLTADSGYFWFFNPANIELVVKVLDACVGFQHFWVFAGGLTNVEVTLTVVDTQTGAVKTYHNPLNTPFAPLQDTSAFVCP